MAENFWTPERIDYLIREWNDGKSAAQIGMALHNSRNAVIGKVHRLREQGVALRKSDGPRDCALTSVLQRRASMVRGNVPTVKRARTSASNALHITGAKPPQPLPAFKPEVVPMTAKPWTERAFQGECAAPVAGSGADLISCGRPCKGSYCDEHRARFFTAAPTSERELIRSLRRVA